jgi:hypothetical protein
VGPNQSYNARYFRPVTTRHTHGTGGRCGSSVPKNFAAQNDRLGRAALRYVRANLLCHAHSDTVFLTPCPGPAG